MSTRSCQILFDAGIAAGDESHSTRDLGVRRCDSVRGVGGSPCHRRELRSKWLFCAEEPEFSNPLKNKESTESSPANPDLGSH